MCDMNQLKMAEINTTIVWEITTIIKAKSYLNSSMFVIWWICVYITCYYAVVIGRNTCPAHLSVCLSVCPVWAPNLKTKDIEKSETGVNIPQGRINSCTNIQLKRSKFRGRVAWWAHCMDGHILPYVNIGPIIYTVATLQSLSNSLTFPDISSEYLRSIDPRNSSNTNRNAC